MKKLVAYFSYSGDTKKTAEAIAKAVGADLFEIIPQKPYSNDYNTCVSEGRKEKRDNARPELKTELLQDKLEEYDTVFIGYPIWWYDGPMIIYSFLEKLDFSGKTIIPFARSGGSGISGSDVEIQKTCPTAVVRKGTMLNGFDDSRIADWARAQTESTTK